MACIGCCSGAGGYIVAMLLCPVREKVRPASEKWPKIGVLWRAGRVFSRIGRRKPHAGRVFRGPAVVGSRRASLLSRAPGSWALLLAVLTLQCAAKPYWWHGGQPAQAATYRVNVRIKGAHVRRMRSQKQKMDLKGSQASRRSPCLPGDDGGGTPKGPAPRCVRGPHHRRRKVTLPATRSVL